jgi:hypothetical protein
MRVAIYARYSSENQSEKSIDDQIRVCQRYLEHHNHSFDEKYIYLWMRLSQDLSFNVLVFRLWKEPWRIKNSI